MTAGRLIADGTVIQKGLSAGERVVTGTAAAPVPRARIEVVRGARADSGGKTVMNISELFIRRRFTKTLIMVGILIFGVMA